MSWSSYGNRPQAAGGQWGHPVGAMGPPQGVSPELWSWFQAVDQDHSGKITIEELQKALLNGNSSPFNEETCRMMVGMFDKDGNGTIDIYEFSTLWHYIQEWRRCFDSFDTDRSGSIDVNELHRALTTFGYRLSMQFCQMIISRFSRRMQHCIGLDDFIQCCVQLHCLTNAFRAKDKQQVGHISLHYEEFLTMVIDTTIRT